MTDDMGLAQAWGNPGNPTFKKRFIRQVAANATTAKAHIELVDVLAGLFNEATAAGVELPAVMEAWEPPAKGQPRELMHYGIGIRCVPGLEPIAGKWGFEADGCWLYFTGGPEEAKKLAQSAETERMLERVRSEGHAETQPDSYYTGRPWTREVRPGDRGDDVLFFKMVYNAPDQDTTFDPWSEGLSRHLQHLWGVRETGTITADIWKGMLPNPSNFNIAYGDTGHIVRVLQACLYAYDWDCEVLMTGRFDQLTHKAVRRIQAEYGLRLTSEMSGAEWAVLLGIRPGQEPE